MAMSRNTGYVMSAEAPRVPQLTRTLARPDGERWNQLE
jgi:hypothetical protein